MKPLIFEFAEMPKTSDFDTTMIEYSDSFNLTVLKNTDTAAISQLFMVTHTVTRLQEEESDSDSDIKNKIDVFMSTETRTHTMTEPSDSDKDVASLSVFMGTRTVTENIEPTDSDK